MRQFQYLLYLFFVMCTLNVHAQNNNASPAIKLHFNNRAGDKDVMLYSENYINAAGDTFSISLLQYFISNIQLIREDGSIYTVPQDSSYFFIQQDDSASQYCSIHAPSDNYKAVSFTVGIDSARCTSAIGKRKGVLDPSLTDMYWGWNSGYIFFKMEGFSSLAPEDAAGLHKFRYHIGGFGGYNAKTINNIKTIQLHLLQTLKPSHTSTIEINVDVLKLFNGITQISIAQHNAIMFDEFSTAIANNFAGMFSVAGIKN